MFLFVVNIFTDLRILGLVLKSYQDLELKRFCRILRPTKKYSGIQTKVPMAYERVKITLQDCEKGFMNVLRIGPYDVTKEGGLKVFVTIS